jgi:mono/diheme cytochrome c family protein
MANPFRSPWFRAATLALTALVMRAGTAFAASPAQVEAGSIFDNLLFVVIGGVMLALFASIAGGAVIAALATVISRFLRRNLPTDEEMGEFHTELGKPSVAPRLPREISPTAEPFVISAVGFVVFLILANIALSLEPPPVAGSHTEETPKSVAESLPKSGDLAEITANLPKGSAEVGARLFVSEGCSGCHSQKKGERLVGPSFYDLWNTAATRVPGLTAKEYIYQSIVDPNVHVVEGFQAGVMQQNYASLLSPQQIADILAWIEERHANEP